MRIILYSLLILLLMSGCVRRVRHIPIEPAVEEIDETPSTGVLYDTTRTESKYSLKQEPYSIGSKQKDPELLGPQRTIDTPTPAQTPVVVETIEKPKGTAKVASLSMTKSECISMIGQAKFDRYSKRFGGGTGAIKRCAILKKLKRN